MIFIHTIVPSPTFTEHTLFADTKEFAKKVIATKTLTVIVSRNTKTTVGISIYSEGFMFGIDSKLCEDLKYHSPNPEWNYFSGEQVQKHFLKILKNQRLEAIQKHVEAAINKFFPVFATELEELNVEYHNTNKLQEITS